MSRISAFAGTFDDRWIKSLESTMVVIGIAGPLATIPQLIKLYFTHSHHAPGQSLVTWGLFAFLSLLWLGYGLVLDKPAIYLGNAVALVMNFLMVVGILIHTGFTF